MFSSPYEKYPDVSVSIRFYPNTFIVNLLNDNIMPLYEYRCKQCGNLVEFRTSMENKAEMAETLECESCGAADFAQVFGGIALTQGSGGSDKPPPPSGGCCPGGMCGI